MKNRLLLILFSLTGFFSFGQVHNNSADYSFKGSINLGTGGSSYSATAPSAWLQLGPLGTNKAMILPRVNDTSNIVSPVDGMKIYSLGTNRPYVRRMGKWEAYILSSDTANIVSGLLRKSDTATMLNGYTRLQRFFDSLAAIRLIIPTNESFFGQNIYSNVIVFAGDSRTAGYDCAVFGTNYPDQVSTTVPFVKYNSGIGGQISKGAVTTAYGNVDGYRSNYARYNIVVIWIGYNDMAVTDLPADSVYNNIIAFANMRRSQGWKVIICTEIDMGGSGSYGSVNATKNKLNDSLLTHWSNFSDAIVRLDTTAQLGVSGARLNATYFCDGVHLTQAGYGVVANMVSAAINRLTVEQGLTRNGPLKIIPGVNKKNLMEFYDRTGNLSQAIDTSFIFSNDLMIKAAGTGISSDGVSTYLKGLHTYTENDLYIKGNNTGFESDNASLYPKYLNRMYLNSSQTVWVQNDGASVLKDVTFTSLLNGGPADSVLVVNSGLTKTVPRSWFLGKADSLSGGYITWDLAKKKIDSLGAAKGPGTVTAVSFTNGGGFTGTVTNPTTTPTLSLVAQDAAANSSTKGFATFVSTNFSASSGIINTIQNIHTAATPQWAAATLQATNPELRVKSTTASSGDFSIGTGYGGVGIKKLYIYDNIAGTSRYTMDENGDNAFTGFINTNKYFSSNGQTNTLLGSGSNYFGYQNYWGIRTATDNSFNIDLYNGGSLITGLNLSQSGNLGIYGSITGLHLIGNSGSLSSSGLGSNVSSVTISGTDIGMQITVTTSGNVSGTIGTITFATAYAVTPKSVVISSANDTTASATSRLFANATGTGTFIIGGGITGAGTYTYNVIVIQ